MSFVGHMARFCVIESGKTYCQKATDFIVRPVVS